MTPEAQAQLESKIEKLEDKVTKLTTSVEDLVTAWNTAKGMTTFVKWLAGVAAACVMLWNLAHNGGTPK